MTANAIGDVGVCAGEWEVGLIVIERSRLPYVDTVTLGAVL